MTKKDKTGGEGQSRAASIPRIFEDDTRSAGFGRDYWTELKELYYFYLDEDSRNRLANMGRVRRSLTILGWLTPLGPVITLITPLIVAIFLAWDNSDLLPARRIEPFGQRFRFLMRSLPFHLGFGLPFLIPILNSLLLSFAPVGATLYMIDARKENTATPP